MAVRVFPTVYWWKAGSQELSNSLLVKRWQSGIFQKIIGEQLAVRDFPTDYWGKVGSQNFPTVELLKFGSPGLSNSKVVKG